MFERQKYKQFARIQLKDRIGLPVLVTFLTIVITGLCSIPYYLSNYGTGFDFHDLLRQMDYDNFIRSYFSVYTNTMKNDFLSTLASLIEAILVYGSLNMYLKMSRSPEPVSFSDFTDGLADFGRAILAFLWKLLWLTLWLMCFVIPGIIKSYEYSMMFYIASEYKHLSVIDALNISKEITRGHKWDLFVLDLSFIGWILLGCISLGIGFLWIIPYITMTQINAYHALLKEAIENGRLDPAILNLNSEETKEDKKEETSDEEETASEEQNQEEFVAQIEDADSENEAEIETENDSDAQSDEENSNSAAETEGQKEDYISNYLQENKDTTPADNNSEKENF